MLGRYYERAVLAHLAMVEAGPRVLLDRPVKDCLHCGADLDYNRTYCQACARHEHGRYHTCRCIACSAWARRMRREAEADHVSDRYTVHERPRFLYPATEPARPAPPPSLLVVNPSSPFRGCDSCGAAGTLTHVRVRVAGGTMGWRVSCACGTVRFVRG